MKDYLDELFDGIDMKKVLIFGPITLIIIGAALWFVLSPSGEEEESVEETVTIQEEDKENISFATERFIKDVGTFGFDYEVAADTGSVLEAKKVAFAYPNEESLFFTSRSRAYLDAREQIAINSPLYYSTSSALTWTSEVELGENKEKIFTVNEVNTEVPDTVAKVDFQGGRFDLVTVKVTFDSKVSYAQQTATDSTWDGTVNIFTKDFNDETLTLKLIKINEEWQPYSIENQDKPFLLATWASPELSYVISELNNGFKKEKEIVIEIPNGNQGMFAEPGIEDPNNTIPTENAGDSDNTENTSDNENSENNDNSGYTEGMFSPAPNDNDDIPTSTGPHPIVNPDGETPMG